jgi:hypothetical protein
LAALDKRPVVVITGATSAVQGAADAVAARWDAMDVWVNNAMVTVFSGIAGLEPNELRRVTEVT